MLASDRPIASPRAAMRLLLPTALVLVAGTSEALRPWAVAMLLVGLGVAIRPRWRVAAVAVAAALPIAIELAWPVLVGRDEALGAACVGPLNAIVVRRLIQVAVVLGVVALLARSLALDGRSIGWQLPRRVAGASTIAGAIVVAVGGLVIGPALAAPMFGPIGFSMPLAAVLPALVFGVANGVLEEVVYRGVLLRWLGGLVGIVPALLLQAVGFGLAHAGPDVVAAMVPLHVAAMAGCGLILGLITLRTGSLAVAIGLHVGADVALYFGLACRPV